MSKLLHKTNDFSRYFQCGKWDKNCYSCILVWWISCFAESKSSKFIVKCYLILPVKFKGEPCNNAMWLEQPLYASLTVRYGFRNQFLFAQSIISITHTYVMYFRYNCKMYSFIHVLYLYANFTAYNVYKDDITQSHTCFRKCLLFSLSLHKTFSI